ncbi:MAG: protein arginine kinase [Clostridiaceae bacterium]|nr:protein arginine kinase [Clostridiaceae bacterium]
MKKDNENRVMRPWYLTAGPEVDVAASSRVRIARNLAGVDFPTRLSTEEKKELGDRIVGKFLAAPGIDPKDWVDVRLIDMDEPGCLSLVEKRLISPELLQNRETARVLIRRDESASLMIGEEDHVRIQAMAPGYDLKRAYDEAESLAKILEAELSVAFTEELGFLTACPTNVGTGLRVSVQLHLPALVMTRELKGLAEALQKAGLAVRGDHGESSAAAGHMFQISNQCTLGVSPQTTLQELTTVVDQLIERERAARETLARHSRLALEDRVWRSLALLQNARSLSEQEAVRLLSDIRLGYALGWLDKENLSWELICRLWAEVGPGSVQRREGEILEPQQRDYKRAEIVRELFAAEREKD